MPSNDNDISLGYSPLNSTLGRSVVQELVTMSSYLSANSGTDDFMVGIVVTKVGSGVNTDVLAKVSSGVSTTDIEIVPAKVSSGVSTDVGTLREDGCPLGTAVGILVGSKQFTEQSLGAKHPT